MKREWSVSKGQHGIIVSKHTVCSVAERRQVTGAKVGARISSKACVQQKAGGKTECWVLKSAGLWCWTNPRDLGFHYVPNLRHCAEQSMQ